MSVKEIGKLRRNLLIALFGALTIHSSVIAHQSKKSQKSPTQEMGETIKIDSSLVEVPVSVTDTAGRPVRNLTAGDFMLEENGRLQQIVSLGDPGEARVEIALLFDITASVYDLFQFERQAALRFLQETLKPRDAVSIFTIGIRPRLIRSRAASATASKKAVGSLVGSIAIAALIALSMPTARERINLGLIPIVNMETASLGFSVSCRNRKAACLSNWKRS